LFHIEKYRDNPEDFSELPRLLRLFDIPVSAGSGNFLEESGFEMVAVPAHVPVSADFALRVSGDSMEPMLQDGQIIWIKEQELLNSGDIGIFIYENDVYCKELVIDSDRLYLRSLNPGYEDVEVNESLGFRVIGKLVA
jgi:phage repressor protein C with HTH and peptisase S24 domain